MHDFTLFDNLNTPHRNKNVPDHMCAFIQNGYEHVCVECGRESFVDQLLYNSEIYNDYRAQRCIIKVTPLKTIYAELQFMPFSERTKSMANRIYVQVCGNDIHRGDFRRAIVFASVFYAYKLDKTPQSCEQLMSLFQLTKKCAQRGLKFVNQNLPNGSPLLLMSTSAADMVREFMHALNATDVVLDEVMVLFLRIEADMRNYKPHALASGLILYHVCLTGRCLDAHQFLNVVRTSEIMVVRVAKECARLLGNETLEIHMRAR